MTLREVTEALLREAFGERVVSIEVHHAEIDACGDVLAECAVTLAEPVAFIAITGEIGAEDPE